MDQKHPLGIYGGIIKAVEGDLNSDEMLVSGPGIVFSDDTKGKPKKDLHGEYFTEKTYLGKSKGDGVDPMFHHGRPILFKGWTNEHYLIPDDLYKFFEEVANHRFTNAIKTKLDDSIGKVGGLAASLVLNMRDDYEKWVAELVTQKALSWSSGSTPHMSTIEYRTGEIKDWPIAEFSLTPTPAEPTASVQISEKSTKSFLKSLDLSKFGNIDFTKLVSEQEQETEFDFLTTEEMEISYQLKRWEHYLST